MPDNIIKVVVVDDEHRALNRMKILLGNFKDIQIMDQIDNSEDAIKYIVEHEPE